MSSAPALHFQLLSHQSSNTCPKAFPEDSCRAAGVALLPLPLSPAICLEAPRPLVPLCWDFHSRPRSWQRPTLSYSPLPTLQAQWWHWTRRFQFNRPVSLLQTPGALPNRLASIYHLKCRFCLHLERLQPHRIRDSIKSNVCEAVSRAETGTGGTGGEAGIQDGAPCDVTGPPASTQGFFWPLATPLSRHSLRWITAEATWLGEKPEGGTGDKVFRAWNSSKAGPSLTSLSRGSSSPSVSKGPRQMHASDSLL